MTLLMLHDEQLSCLFWQGNFDRERGREIVQGDQDKMLGIRSAKA